MVRLIAFLSFLSCLVACTICLLGTGVTAAAGDRCTVSSQCDSSAPCCSEAGVCGSGSLACAGGCNPLSSHSPSSCQPNPICVSQNVTFHPNSYNNASVFRPILQYNGNANLAPFTLDSGSLGQGPEGVLAQMTIDRQVKLSTTRYVLYGDIEAKLRHNASAGLVATFILMSDVKDEVDWEFTTASASNAQTNYFSLGVARLGQGENVGPSSLDVSQWNTFGLNWQPNSLQWKINGQVVRTLKRSEAGTSYPRSPARVQLSVWAGGNATEPEGTRTWAGGAIDYSSAEYAANGWYAMELGSFSINCASTSAANIGTQGKGSNITAWVYTGNNDTTGEPSVVLSTDSVTYLKDPSAGGYYGLPGWTDAQTASTKSSSNMWDGSGDTGADDSTASKSGSGFNKAAAMKYGIPIAAGVVGVIALWFCVMYCVRKKRNERRRAEIAAGGIGVASVGKDGRGPPSSAALSSGYISRGHAAKAGPGGAKYAALGDDYPTYSDEQLPLGAEKMGGGIGPAAGPKPGSRMPRMAHGETIGDNAPGKGERNGGMQPNHSYRGPSNQYAYQVGSFAPTSAQQQPYHGAAAADAWSADQHHGYDSYAMTPPPGVGGQWARAQTPQSFAQPSAGGWGTGGGYGASQYAPRYEDPHQHGYAGDVGYAPHAHARPHYR